MNPKRRKVSPPSDADPFVCTLYDLIKEQLLVDLVPLVLGYYGLAASRLARSFCIRDKEQLSFHHLALCNKNQTLVVGSCARSIFLADIETDQVKSIMKFTIPFGGICAYGNRIYMSAIDDANVLGINTSGREFARVTNLQQPVQMCASKKELFFGDV